MVSQLVWLNYREVKEMGWKDRSGGIVKVLECPVRAVWPSLLRAERSPGRFQEGK